MRWAWVARSLARRLLPRRAKAFLRRIFPTLLAGRPAQRDLRRRGIPPTMTPEGYDVIVFPIIDWFFLFQRPQQLSLQFARNGQRVFYTSMGFVHDFEDERFQRLLANAILWTTKRDAAE